ncbi:MAG: hypothetical protein ABFD90_17710 [Phycisphaerales bacterium]
MAKEDVPPETTKDEVHELLWFAARAVIVAALVAVLLLTVPITIKISDGRVHIGQLWDGWKIETR